MIAKADGRFDAHLAQVRAEKKTQRKTQNRRGKKR
jgi:hypothetical protein